MTKRELAVRVLRARAKTFDDAATAVSHALRTGRSPEQAIEYLRDLAHIHLGMEHDVERGTVPPHTVELYGSPVDIT